MSNPARSPTGPRRSADKSPSDSATQFLNVLLGGDIDLRDLLQRGWTRPKSLHPIPLVVLAARGHLAMVLSGQAG
jgi:hypothetical protein